MERQSAKAFRLSFLSDIRATPGRAGSFHFKIQIKFPEKNISWLNTFPALWNSKTGLNSGFQTRLIFEREGIKGMMQTQKFRDAKCWTTAVMGCWDSLFHGGCQLAGVERHA